MGRLVGLVIITTALIGVLMTFHVPFSWVGKLPGDISFTFKQMKIFLPFATSFIFSLVLSVFLFLFGRH